MLNKFSNEEVARLLRQVSAALTIKNENRFRIIAYDKASESIGSSNIDVKDLWKENRLSELPGIGKGIASNLDELFKTGKVSDFAEIFKDLPKGMFTLLDVSGFGPKKAYALSTKFKLNDAEAAINSLLEIAKSGKIASLPGFGEKSQTDIIEALKSFKTGQTKKKRMPLPYAYETASKILNYLKKNKSVKNAYPLGSLRRMVSTIGDIDIGVATDDPKSALDWFLKYPKKASLVESGPAGATIILDTGQHVDLRVQYPKAFGAMLQYFTGNLNHNIKLREIAIKKGLSLNEYGIKNKKSNKLKEFATEDELYKFLGLNWIAPEIREDNGEIEASLKNKLPDLVEKSDIKGEVHIHSSYDLKPSHDLGTSSVKELLENAEKLKYEYLGISDHNPSFSNQSENQIIAIMKRRKEHFEQIISSNKSIRVKLFTMLEVDILPDGKLALPKKAFDYVDAVLVSVHSSFTQDQETTTKRILKGLSHPKARIFAHPSGRLIGKREAIDANWNSVFDFCKKNNKALEINSSPGRLDLADIMVKRAVQNGNKLVIDSDSHHKDQMNLMEYGISVARRGWATKQDILNTLSYDEFKKWLLSY